MTRITRRTEKTSTAKKKSSNKPKKILQYEERQMIKAVEEVQAGKTIATSARDNNVPRATLHYKVKGLRPIKRRMGPDPILNEEEEKIVVNWIVSCARVGFPVTQTDLLDSIKRLLEDIGRDNPFVDNRPGRSWYKSFLLRNPTVTVRTAQNLTISRSSVKSEDLLLWFTTILNYLKEHHHDHVLNDPTRVFNGDESAFFLNPKGNSVLARKGDKTVYQQVNSDDKECITVLVTANAAGQLAPPLVVFKYDRIPMEIALSVRSHWGIGKSETGWMNGGLFYEFITNVFHPWLVRNNITLPVILFIDGHSSHLTLHTSAFCDEHGIILIALFPNATHLLQPMDVSVFRSLKGSWKDKVHEWRLANIKNPILKKKDFAPLLEQVLDEINPAIIQSGFRKCGLVPWNPGEVTETLSLRETAFKPTSCIPVKSSCKTQGNIKSALEVVEEFMGSEKVELFKSSEVWAGFVGDQSLFNLWKQIKSAAHEANFNLSQITENISTSESFSGILEENERHEPLIVSQQETPSTGDIPEINPCEPSTSHEQEVTPSAGLNIPSPFKRALIWPDTVPVKNKRKREVLPSVVTSQPWREYHEKKAKKKMETETLKKERALERARKKSEKEELQKKKQEEKERKKNAVPTKKTRAKKTKEVVSSSESEEWEPSGTDGSIGGDEGGEAEASNDDKVFHVRPDNDQSELSDPHPSTSSQGQAHPPEDTHSGIDKFVVHDDKVIEEIWNLDGLDIGSDELNSSNQDDHETHKEVEEKENNKNVNNGFIGEEIGGKRTIDDTQEKVCQEMNSHVSSSINTVLRGPEEDRERPGEEKKGIMSEDAEEGQFVLVKFRVGGREVEKICKIKMIMVNGCVVVSTLTPVTRQMNIYEINEKDTRRINKQQIVKLLRKPLQFGSKIQFPT